MSVNGTFAVIPVKRFTSAKQRLSPFLHVSERARVARLMFEDVLAAALAARELSGVFVVTADPQARAIAQEAGARVIWEMSEYGFAAAISTAIRELRRIGASGMIVVPTDIPHITPNLIDEIVAYTQTPGVTMVSARSDGGTNLLAVRPCDLLPPKFGHDSLIRHCAAALEAGVEPLVLTSRVASHDLDRPNDLLDFLALGTPTRTQKYLAGLNLARRQRSRT